MGKFIVSLVIALVLSLPFSSISFAMGLPQEASHPDTGVQEPPNQEENSRQTGKSNKPEEHQHEYQMSGTQNQMKGMQHRGMGMYANSLIEEIIHHGTAGTSVEPISTSVPMLMTIKGNWMLMFHGVAFLNSTQQSGPRGFDKVFSTNWLMPMAQRQVGPGTLTVRTMLSFEPATVTKRRYPELFQLGEVAFGEPIVDGQHPHDFFMELAALYDLKLGENALLSFYAAPVGDPAMGPTAFPHRMSASENPLAPLGHHLQDSTHIANDVFTLGLTFRRVRLEASAFHGREPDEHRWNIDSGKMDSWSTRLTISPSQNWSGQYSLTRLKSPEELNPREDILRMTASIMYNRPLRNGNWATTLLWGRNRTSPGREVSNGYLAESTFRFLTRNYVWGRVENLDRTNQLLLGEKPVPPGFEEHFFARVQAYTVGYSHDFDVIPHLATALGGQMTFYAAPSSLDSIYGSHSAGLILFLRVRPFGVNR
ncbi:MAG TPA: hypothetical protein VHM88_05565 [Candidatus Acidoferrales bacterium]|nr:hypothetical protein [Candidatus Acidoferrales bacterium]